MVMADKMMSNDPMDDLLAAARRTAPEPSAALLARVLADGEAELAARARPTPMPQRARPAGSAVGALWTELLAIVGGWRALGGLATAALAGVWIGFSGAAGLSVAATELLTGTNAEILGTVNLLPGDDVFALAMGLEEIE